MSGVEFARPYRLDTLSDAPRDVTLQADPAERAALAVRFALVSLDRLEASATLVRHGATIDATGRLKASLVQRCVATDQPLPAKITTTFTLRFVPAGEAEAGAEIELSAADCDVVEYDGGAIDLGEAVAETLALALDPFPRSADAEAALRAAGVVIEGEEQRPGAFAGLKAMLDSKGPSA